MKMHGSTRVILVVFAGLLASVGSLWASTMATETRLGRDVACLNRLGRTPQGEMSLTPSLERRFRAESARINEMRRARLGYGDISVALALASDLPGGVTKTNVKKIVARWRSSRAERWPLITRSLGVRLERVMLQIESLKARPVAKPMAASERPRSHDSV